MPLHVFEPRYRAMLAHCLSTHGAMVIAHLIGGEDEHGRPRIAPIAGGGIVDRAPGAAGRPSRTSCPRPSAAAARRARAGRVATVSRWRARPCSRTAPSRFAEHDRTALVAAATMFAAEVKKHDPHVLVPHAGHARRRARRRFVRVPARDRRRRASGDARTSSTRVRASDGAPQLALQHGAMIQRQSGRRCSIDAVATTARSSVE